MLSFYHGLTYYCQKTCKWYNKYKAKNSSLYTFLKIIHNQMTTSFSFQSFRLLQTNKHVVSSLLFGLLTTQLLILIPAEKAFAAQERRTLRSFSKDKCLYFHSHAEDKLYNWQKHKSLHTGSQFTHQANVQACKKY